MPRHNEGNTFLGPAPVLPMGMAASLLQHGGSYSWSLTHLVKIYRKHKSQQSSVDTVPVTLVFQHNHALLFLDKKITDFVFTFEVRMRHLW